MSEQDEFDDNDSLAEVRPKRVSLLRHSVDESANVTMRQTRALTTTMHDMRKRQQHFLPDFDIDSTQLCSMGTTLESEDEDTVEEDFAHEYE
ncbi:MAG: hypothetical protein MHM6MM_002497 [Cercozoa sp. M6MM]